MPDGSAEMRHPAASTALALVALERDDLGAAREHLTAARPAARWCASPSRGPSPPACSPTSRPRPGESRPALAHLELLCGRADVATPGSPAGCGSSPPSSPSPTACPTTRYGRWTCPRTTAPPARSSPPRRTPSRAGACALERSLTLARATARPLPVEVTRLLVEGVHESRRPSSRRAAPLVEQALALAARRGGPATLPRGVAGGAPAARRAPHLLERHRWLGRRPRPHPAGAGVTADARARSRGRPPERRSVAPTTARARDHQAAARGGAAHRQGATRCCATSRSCSPPRRSPRRCSSSVNTVRTHVRSILRKLGVNRRNSAVRRARELGLFDDAVS